MEKLLNKVEEEEKKAASAEFDRLEALLIEQQEARIRKDAAKRKVAEDAKDAAIAAAEARGKGDLDMREKLEEAQKEAQMRREELVVAEARKAELEAVVQSQQPVGRSY